MLRCLDYVLEGTGAAVLTQRNVHKMCSTIVKQLDSCRCGYFKTIQQGASDAVADGIRIINHDFISRRAILETYLETGP